MFDVRASRAFSPGMERWEKVAPLARRRDINWLVKSGRNPLCGENGADKGRAVSESASNQYYVIAHIR